MPFLINLVYAFVVFFGYSIIRKITTARRSPLSRIPGPWHTLYTPLVSQIHRILGTKTYYIASLHKQYNSPIVRVEPHQVSSSDPSNWESMHRMGYSGGFRKTAFHERFRIGQEHVLFSIVDVRKHAARRRLFARALSKENVRRNWESVIKRRVELAVRLIKTEMCDSLDGECDILKWWRLMAADVIGLLCFGEGEFDMLLSSTTNSGSGPGTSTRQGQRDGKDRGDSDIGEEEYFDALQNAGAWIILRESFPGWLLKGIVKLGWPKRLGQIMRANEIITGKGAVAVSNSKKKKGADGMETLFRNILAEAEKEELEKEGGQKDAVKGLTDDAINSEAAGFLLAGSDTTSISITYALWAILKRVDLRRRLEEEVEKQLGDGDFTDKHVEDKCPLLNSVIEESMRLYNPAAGPLIRRTPPEGVMWNGYFIPGGDDVYVMPWMLVRDETVFPDPDRFDETRFLNPTDAQRRLAKPFGIGSRSCIGIPVAQMEIRFAVALFLRECKGARLGRNMTDEMMEQRTKFFTYPKGGRCDIRLENA